MTGSACIQRVGGRLAPLYCWLFRLDAADKQRHVGMGINTITEIEHSDKQQHAGMGSNTITEIEHSDNTGT